jgi:plasmid stability protein
MATLTIKGVPDDLYDRLKVSAAEHRRSLNSEAIVRLEQALGRQRIDKEALLARIDARREQLAKTMPPLTDEFLREAKNEGRP